MKVRWKKNLRFWKTGSKKSIIFNRIYSVATRVLKCFKQKNIWFGVQGLVPKDGTSTTKSPDRCKDPGFRVCRFKFNWCRYSLWTYIVFICVFLLFFESRFLFQKYNFKGVEVLLEVQLVSVLPECVKIKFWSLPNIGLVLEWPPSSLRSFLMRRKNWRCGGGYKNGARESSRRKNQAAILKQWWWSRNRWSLNRLIHDFTFLRWKLHCHDETACLIRHSAILPVIH